MEMNGGLINKRISISPNLWAQLGLVSRMMRLERQSEFRDLRIGFQRYIYISLR